LAQAITNKAECQQMKLGYDDLIVSLGEAGAATASHLSHWLQRRARPSSRISEASTAGHACCSLSNVRTLFEQGLSQRAIACKLKLSRATVSKFVQAQQYPEMHHPNRGARRSLLDPYKRYLLQRWQDGCRNSVQLYDEITARGYKGSAPLLRTFLAELRKKHQQAGSASVLTLDACTQAIAIPASLPPKPRIACHMSATRASWLFVSQAGKLDAKQTQPVEQIRARRASLGAGVSTEPGVCDDAGRAPRSRLGCLADPS